MQGRNKDTDVENKHMDTKGGKRRGGGGGGVMNWDIGIDMYSPMYIKLMTSKNLLYKKIKKIKFKKKKKKNNVEFKPKRFWPCDSSPTTPAPGI